MHRTTLALVGLLLLAGCVAPEADDARRVGEATLAAGGSTHLLLHLNSTQDANASIEVEDADGLDVVLPDTLHANGSGVAGWIGVQVPAGLSGDHEVVLRVAGERIAWLIHVQEPETVLETGDVALANLTLRTPDGELALTTHTAVDAAPLQRTEGYEAAPEPLQLPLDPRSGLPEALLDAMAGIGVGHSGTVDLPDFYGAEVLEHERPRTEDVPRVQERQRVFEAPRDAAEAQGLIAAGTEEGDRIELGGLPYDVELLNETVVRARLNVSEGERHTLHEAWPDATHVAHVDEDVVRLRTDPPEGTFTWLPAWPGATEVAGMNDTSIRLRHSPEEGLEYTRMGQQGPMELTVAEVREDVIVVTQANPHPLAGRTMVIDFTIVERQDAPQGVPRP